MYMLVLLLSVYGSLKNLLNFSKLQFFKSKNNNSIFYRWIFWELNRLMYAYHIPQFPAHSFSWMLKWTGVVTLIDKKKWLLGHAILWVSERRNIWYDNLEKNVNVDSSSIPKSFQSSYFLTIISYLTSICENLSVM
jgi:hypothetical protein